MSDIKPPPTSGESAWYSARVRCREIATKLSHRGTLQQYPEPIEALEEAYSAISVELEKHRRMRREGNSPKASAA